MSIVRLVQLIPSPPDGGRDTGDIGRALAAILSFDSLLGNALGHPLPASPIDGARFIQQTAEWCKSHDAASFAILGNQYMAVGQLSISQLGDKDGRGRIGYWLASDHWGKRIMTEAFGQALAVAKSLGLKSVSGHVPAGNIASERLWLRHGEKRSTAGKGSEFTIVL